MKQFLKNILFQFKTFHSNRCYIIFQLIQLLLALSIIIRALTSTNHFKSSDVMIMQYILLSLIFIDMIIRIFALGWINFIKGKGNAIDLVIFILFTITLIALTIIQKQQAKQILQNKNTIINQKSQVQISVQTKTEQYQEFLQTDDIIIITIVMTRYIIQIVRMIFTIRNTHKNIEISKTIKSFDLNLQNTSTDRKGHFDANNNSIVLDQSIRVDEAVKQKIMQIKSKKSNDDYKKKNVIHIIPGEQVFSQRDSNYQQKNESIQLQQIKIDDFV